MTANKIILHKYKWTILWSIFVVVLTGIPGDNIPKNNWLDKLMIDKVVHISMYAGFSFLFIFESNGKFAALGLLLGILFGVLMEIFQLYVFVSRSFDFYDMLANSIGAILGILFYFIVFKRKM